MRHWQLLLTIIAVVCFGAVLSYPIRYRMAEESKGDSITFDLVLGGDAASAVIFSENDSVWFDAMQYTESGRVTGTVTGADLNWGVVFLTDSGELLDTVYLGR